MENSKMTLYMGDLEPWMDENYLKQLWLSMGENVNIKMIRDKATGANAGYCFVDFSGHNSAVKYLSTVNGTIIPGTNRVFKLNWASGTQSNTPEYSVFVGDLGPEVTDFMLLRKFQSRYPNCRSAKVVMDPVTGTSRGYGFVRFSNENEQQRAMAEMDGHYCGSRAMRISVATPKNKAMLTGINMKPMGGMANGVINTMGAVGPAGPGARMTDMMNVSMPYYGQQPTQPYNQFSDPHNTTVFVGGLNSQLTDEELRSYFSPFGDIIYTKIPPGKGCGFVQFLHRQSAEIAIRQMNGFMIGGSRVRLSWGRSQAAAKGDYRPYQPQNYPVQQAPASQAIAPSQYPVTGVQSHAQGQWVGYSAAPMPMVNVQPASIPQPRNQVVAIPQIPQIQYHMQPCVYQPTQPARIPLQTPVPSPLAPVSTPFQNSEYLSKKIELSERMDLNPSRNSISVGVSME